MPSPDEPLLADPEPSAPEPTEPERESSARESAPETDAETPPPIPPKPCKPRPPTKRQREQAIVTARRKEDRREARLRVLRVVEEVAMARGVPAEKLFSPLREGDAVSSARVLAMGLCCALGVPIHLTARAFSRNWATVHCATRRCAKLYRTRAGFCEEWDGLVGRCGGADG